MTLIEFMDERYKNREDKDNIFGVGVSDAEFRTFIIDYLLGEDWYVVDPIGQTQINEIALYEILEKYSKRYRKECKGRKRGRHMITILIYLLGLSIIPIISLTLFEIRGYWRMCELMTMWVIWSAVMLVYYIIG